MTVKRRAAALFILILLPVLLTPGCTKATTVKDTRGITTTTPAVPAVFSHVKAGDTVKFGRYEQDNIAANGKEPVSWKVLAVKDGKALLISQKSLDSYDYTDTAKKYTWESCKLQAWLNNEFLNSAFTGDEQKAVAESKTGAAGITDKVFCLSREEAEKYFTNDKARITESTAYAKSHMSFYDGGRDWWLRSPYSAADTSPAGVADNGKIVPSGNGGMIGLSGIGIRPAVWVLCG